MNAVKEALNRYFVKSICITMYKIASNHLKAIIYVRNPFNVVSDTAC